MGMHFFILAQNENLDVHCDFFQASCTNTTTDDVKKAEKESSSE